MKTWRRSLSTYRARELTLKFDVGKCSVMKMEKFWIVHVLKWSPVWLQARGAVLGVQWVVLQKYQLKARPQPKQLTGYDEERNREPHRKYNHAPLWIQDVHNSMCRAENGDTDTTSQWFPFEWMLSSAWGCCSGVWPLWPDTGDLGGSAWTGNLESSGSRDLCVNTSCRTSGDPFGTVVAAELTGRKKRSLAVINKAA